MRLHALRLRAFGPFVAEQRIDFDPLGVGGLFLLDGPTGAGKTTVLDAITFALYGPGERGGDGRLQSHFAAPGERPEVELEFSVRGARHRVTRSPDYLRPKRRGAGTLLERGAVHLERLEAGRWVSRSSRKDEVGDLLADEIGLSRDQFTQVVLLPQGRFMRFLRAGDDDRRVLLTRLFGTEFYDRVTDELDRRRKVADHEVAAAAARTARCVAAAAEAAGLDAAAAETLAGCDASAQLAELQRIAERLAAEREATDAERERAAADLPARRTAAADATRQADHATRLAEVLAAAAEHERDRSEQEQLAAAVASAERAEPVRPLLDGLAEAARAAEHATRLLRRLAPQASAEWLVGEGADELAEGAGVARNEAGELEHLVLRETELAQLRRRAAELASAAAAEAVALETARSRQGELPALLAAADAALRLAAQRGSAAGVLRTRRDALTAQHGAAVALAELAPLLADAAQRRAAAFERYAHAVDEHHRRTELRLAGMAAELAADLAAGEPCPVCGAAEHPAPARPADDAVSAADVAAAAATRHDADTGRQRCAVELAALERRYAVLAARAADAGEEAGAVGPLDVAAVVAALRDEVAVTRVAVTESERAADECAALDEAKGRLEVERDRLADARAEIESRHATAAAAHAAADLEVADAERALSVAAGEHDSVAARQHALRDSAALADAVAGAVRDVGAARTALDRARDRAADLSRAQGFTDAGAAAAVLLGGADLDDARARVARWRERGVRVHVLLAELTGARGDGSGRSERGERGREREPGGDRERGGERELGGHLTVVGDPDVMAAELVAAAARSAGALAAAEADAERATLRADRTRRVEERFLAAAAQVRAAREQHAELERAGAPVVHLAKLARGMAGRRRVNLTTYVLRQWFEQVVAAANVRLAGMSSGRYELVRVDDSGPPSERAGLTLQVLDRHTGEQRSTRSLSGGETFYASLALALGLADVVRAEAGGVDLDTLFIDEGFGSLDPDTLDQVMAVIDELRGHGRTVGIVSHVSELKHRISERIEVRRLPDGSSTLRVVA